MSIFSSLKESADKLLFIICFFAVISLFAKNLIFCKVIVFCIILLCILYGSREKKIVNPYYLFVLTPLTLIMYVNIGSMYMLDLTESTWNLAIINMLGFIIGLRYARHYHVTGFEKGYIKQSNAIGHMLFFYMLSLVAPFSGPFYSVLSLLGGVSITIAFTTRKKILILGYTILFFAGMILGATSKSAVLTLCFTFLICFETYYVNDQKQKIKVMLLGLAAIFLMIFSFSFANKERGHYDSDEGTAYYTRGGLEWNYDNSLFMPYMYLTTAWGNVQYVTETQSEHTYGLWAAKPILGYLQLDDYFQDNYRLEPFSSFNTFTFITVLFKDFGYYGSILLSFILGFFVKKVYSCYLQIRSPLVVACYILVAQATFQMFFSNHFFMQSYPFTIVIIMWIYAQFFTTHISNNYNKNI